MKRYLLTLATMLTFALGATAQYWWTPADRYQYNDETVVYATLQLDGLPVGSGNTEYSVAAFIGDECRAVADARPVGNEGETVFTLCVLGDRQADAGQPVRFEIRYNVKQLGLVYDAAPSAAVVFNSRTWGMPSEPVVLSSPGYDGDALFAVAPATINVGEQLDLLSLYLGKNMPKHTGIALSTSQYATLDGTVVTGVKPGVFIYDIYFPGATLSNTINVVNPATALNITNDEVHVDIEMPWTLQPKLNRAYELLPENTTEYVTWFIDDETIVSIDEEGNLIPVGVGQTYVTPKVLAMDGSVRLLPTDGRRILVVVYENVPLQHFEYTLSSPPYNRETVQMTLTPVPANATFDIMDLNFYYYADYGWDEQWQIVDISLASRNPIIYNLTFTCPIGVEIWANMGDRPDARVELWPAGSNEDNSYISPYFRLNLEEGWQWRSNPDGLLWDDHIQAGFGPDLIEVRTQTKALYNDPVYGYFGSLMEEGIDDNVAYKVRMAADYRSRTVSHTIGAGTTRLGVNVREGWTWIPTPYLYDRRLENIFDPAQLTEGMVIISKEQGSAEWNGTEWEGDLQVLPTEQSFLFYMPEGESFRLRYETERGMPQGDESAEPSARSHAEGVSPFNVHRAEGSFNVHSVARRFRDNMTMVVTMPQLAEPAGYELRAYVGDEMRGLGHANAAGRFFVTVHADGGEQVSFRIADLNTGAEYAVDERITSNEPRLGSLRQPVELHSTPFSQGVGTVHCSDFTVHSYDLLGRPVADSQKGAITIQRSADGRVRKVIRK